MEVFWNGEEDALSFFTHPGHLQLKLLLFVVLVNQVNASQSDQT